MRGSFYLPELPNDPWPLSESDNVSDSIISTMLTGIMSI
jgi:hypothetical protein